MKIILIDLDSTIFKSHEFIYEVWNYYEILFKLESGTFKKSYENFKNQFGAYDFFKHLKYFNKNLKIKNCKNEIENLFKNENFNYKEVDKFFEIAKNKNFKIIIYTLGFLNFQKLKINLLKAFKLDYLICVKDKLKSEYLKSIIDFENKTLNFKKAIKVDEIIYIDDSPKSFLNFNQKLIKQFWIVREDNKYKDFDKINYLNKINNLLEIFNEN